MTSQRDILEAFYEYCFNELPTRLINLRNMKLVGREDVVGYVASQAENYVSHTDYSSPDPTTFSEDNFSHYYQLLAKYAILSHRWLPRGEPTFENVSEGDLPLSAGTEKLWAFCRSPHMVGYMLH
jgi:hypothetical protein